MDFIHEENKIRFNVGHEEFFCNTYFPETKSELKEYGLMFVLSPYYTAELDYHEVFINGKTSTAGWLMPISLLEETESTIISGLPRFLSIFSDIAIKKLLLWYINNKGMDNIATDKCSLSKMFNSDISVFVYRHSIVSPSDISSYIPSLYDSGYYFVDNPLESNISWYISNKMRIIANDSRTDGKIKMVLNKLKPLNYGEEYIKTLYKNILPYSQDIFQRFIVLYQVMEILMGEEFEFDVFRINVDYAKGVITKNDLRQKLQDATSEDTKLNRALDGVHTNEYMQDFMDSVRNLLDKIGRDYSQCHTYAHFMYIIRNTIVHSLRDIVSYETSIRTIVELYEKNIFHILCNHTIREDSKDMLFYADRTKSHKSNLRNFRKFLSEKMAR